jgi:hypothetical protein
MPLIALADQSILFKSTAPTAVRGGSKKKKKKKEQISKGKWQLLSSQITFAD